MHCSTGQGGSRDIRRAEAHDKAGQGLGHSSLGRAYPRQAEAAGQFDQALQDALSNPKHRMLGASLLSALLHSRYIAAHLRAHKSTFVAVAVLRLEDEVRDFVQSTRSTLVYGESLNGFQARTPGVSYLSILWRMTGNV